MKIPLYLFLNVFRKVFFPLFSIVLHFVLKTEWFDVRDCATMTVVIKHNSLASVELD